MSEIAFDSFKQNEIVMHRCCYCGIEEINIENEVKGTRHMCDECLTKKERVKAGSKTSNKEKSINSLKEWNWRKRRKERTY